jgi:hypothetical protein
LTVLDRYHTPSRETLAVSQPVNLIENRDGWITWAKEVRMQRVHAAIAEVDSACSRDEGLTGDLATEHTLTVFIGASATEDVDLDGLDVEQGDEVV